MPLLPKPSACNGCPAYDIGKSFVRSTGPKDADIAMLGQGPGEIEAYQGVPFVGQSGHRLNHWLFRARLPRYKIHIDNIVKCWLPGNRPPTQAEVAFCRQAHWQSELDALNWRVLVPVGVPAMKTFLGNRAGAHTAGHVIPFEDTNDQAYPGTQRESRTGPGDRDRLAVAAVPDKRLPSDAGQPTDSALRGKPGPEPVRANGSVADVEPGEAHQQYIVPLLHPSYIQRGQFAQEPAQVLYLKRIKEISETGTWKMLTPGEAPPGTMLYPTLEDMHQWEKDLWEFTCDNPTETDEEGFLLDWAGAETFTQGCTVDIENAGDHITIVGLCRIKDLIPIVIRFRRKGGLLYWRSHSELRAVVTWLFGILSNAAIPKVFHNGQAHDIPILEKSGLITRNYSFDTMLGQHIAYPELPKKLEFVANLYAGMAGWKAMVGEDEGEGK